MCGTNLGKEKVKGVRHKVKGKRCKEQDSRISFQYINKVKLIKYSFLLEPVTGNLKLGNLILVLLKP